MGAGKRRETEVGRGGGCRGLGGGDGIGCEVASASATCMAVLLAAYLYQNIGIVLNCTRTLALF